MHPNLLSLLQLTDPTLPIGGYAHSFGLETYVQEGIVTNYTTATAFVTGMLQQSIRYTDGAFVSLAYDAAEQNDWERIVALNNECTAVKLAGGSAAGQPQTRHAAGKNFSDFFKCPYCTEVCRSSNFFKTPLLHCIWHLRAGAAHFQGGCTDRVLLQRRRRHHHQLCEAGTTGTTGRPATAFLITTPDAGIGKKFSASGQRVNWPV
jgi:urease accessory protein UreF